MTKAQEKALVSFLWYMAQQTREDMEILEAGTKEYFRSSSLRMFVGTILEMVGELDG